MESDVSANDLPVYITVFDANGNQTAQYTLSAVNDSVEISYNDGASTATITRTVGDDGFQSILATVTQTSSNVNQLRLLFPYIKASYETATMQNAERALPRVATRNVHYIYEESGNYVTDIYKQYGLSGDNFTTGAIDVPGYKLSKVIGQEEGTLKYYTTSASANIGKVSQQYVNNGNYIFKWTNIGIDNDGYIRKLELIDAATGEVVDSGVVSYNQTYTLGSSGNSTGSYQITYTNRTSLPNTDTYYYYVKMDDSESESQSMSYSTSNSESVSASESISNSESLSTSESMSSSESLSTSTSNSFSESLKESVSESISESVSESVSKSISESVSESVSESISESVSESVSESISESVSESVSESISESVSESVSESISESISESVSESISEPVSESVSESISESLSESVSESISESVSESVSESISESLSESVSESISESLSESVSESISESVSDSVSESISTSESTSNS